MCLPAPPARPTGRAARLGFWPAPPSQQATSAYPPPFPPPPTLLAHPPRRQGPVEDGEAGKEGGGGQAHPRPQAQAPVQRQAPQGNHRPAVACTHPQRLPSPAGWLVVPGGGAGWRGVPRGCPPARAALPCFCCTLLPCKIEEVNLFRAVMRGRLQEGALCPMCGKYSGWRLAEVSRWFSAEEWL